MGQGRIWCWRLDRRYFRGRSRHYAPRSVLISRDQVLGKVVGHGTLLPTGRYRACGWPTSEFLYWSEGEPTSSRPMLDDAMVGFSWLLVTAIGLLPLAEASLHRAPSVTMPAVSAFFVAVASGIALRRRYSWLGVVLHIYGQIAIWLSLFVMSLAAVLVALGHH